MAVHDAYTLCWEDGEKITDYYVEFEGTDALSRIATDENVMLTADRVSVPLTDGRLPISREVYPQANIVAVDYDPGASKINQENRIKLMLSSAE